MSTNLENPAVATGLEEVSFSSQFQRRAVQRMLIALTSHSSEVILKILQAMLQ